MDTYKLAEEICSNKIPLDLKVLILNQEMSWVHGPRNRFKNMQISIFRLSNMF